MGQGLVLDVVPVGGRTENVHGSRGHNHLAAHGPGQSQGSHPVSKGQCEEAKGNRRHHEVVELVIHGEGGRDAQVVAGGPDQEVVDGRAEAVQVTAVNPCGARGSALGSAFLRPIPRGHTWDDDNGI